MRGVPVALDAQADVVAVGVREHDVEEDEVGHDLLDERQALTAVAPHGDGHVVRLQAPLEDVRRCRVVLDDHDAGQWLGVVRYDGHAGRSCSPSRWFIATTYLDGRSLTMCSRM